jgi:hypothetical protein
MMGGAVAAAVRDGSAAWYNPAGLGGVERDQIDASASVYTLRQYSAPAYMGSTDGESEDAAVREFFGSRPGLLRAEVDEPTPSAAAHDR